MGAPSLKNGGSGARYRWGQSAREVTIAINAGSRRGRDFRVDVVLVDEDDADLRRPGLVPHLAVRGVRLPLLELLVHLGDERLDAVEVAVAHLVEERALLGLARERDDGLVPARPRSRSPPREGRVDAGARAGCRRGSGTRRSSG